MKFLKELKSKSKEIAILYAIVFIPMWTLFLVNTVFMSGALNQIGGIHPRDVSFSGLLSILTSWAFHGGGTESTSIFSHVLGNSEILLVLLMVVGIFEKRPLLLIGLLILASGFATWLLGAPNSLHIGASGLVFAIMGYVVASIFLARRWLYLIPLIGAGGTYIYSLQMGLIPSSGTSFAAHFGGLVGGVVVAYLIGKNQKYKEKIASRGSLYQPSRQEVVIKNLNSFFKRKK